jgi:glucosamine 6-phosphate synthetase-like amidotransferase/phosphosugar isomerase protein
MRRDTGLWADVRELPESIASTLDAADGFAETAALLSGPDVRRIVASGNGASYYVAHALWLAAAAGPGRGPDVVAVPAGLIAGGWFRFGPGDRLLAVSSSGEFRDLVEAIDRGAVPAPYAAVTATAGSTIERGAGARALQRVLGQRAVTHTQALAGGLACALALWARIAGDGELAAAVSGLPGVLSAAVEEAEAWAAGLGELQPPAAAVAFSAGPGWAAALEAALLVKEVAGVPAEGVDAREGATSAMYALGAAHLAVSLPVGDPAEAEAERVCGETGARVVRCPGGERTDARLALAATLPSATALAAVLAERARLDVDRPAWVDAYYRTARRASAETGDG